MSSKMREALRDLLRRYENENQCYPGARPNQLIDEIAQRYGDLEFTREEMLELMVQSGYEGAANKHVAQEILARHLGEGESGVPKQWAKVESEHGITNVALLADDDDTPTIKASEIEAVTGEKVPAWARWAAYSEVGPEATVLYEYRPSCYYPGERWSSKGGRTHVLPKEVIRAHRYYLSLRRIIHDEPKTRPAPSDMERRVLTLETEIGEVGELSDELIELTNCVAAIETRLLADGHSRHCPRYLGAAECTCGHDELKEMSK